ncbi:MAG TPA: hypothetical protein VMM60_02085, partial [Ilumatobacter sp.]|nr:hypothetical protein [Ilumatobacter sp.]
MQQIAAQVAHRESRRTEESLSFTISVRAGCTFGFNTCHVSRGGHITSTTIVVEVDVARCCCRALV